MRDVGEFFVGEFHIFPKLGDTQEEHIQICSIEVGCISVRLMAAA